VGRGRLELQDHLKWEKKMRGYLHIVLSAFIILGTSLVPSHPTYAASAQEIELETDTALERFRKDVRGGEKFLQAAQAVLVFPNVVKAGFVIGGEYGEGALRIGEKTEDYYSTAAGSIGFQLGIQSKAVLLVFLEKKALAEFRQAEGWEIGVDGSVVLIKVGAGGAIDTSTIKDPIVGFVMTNKGLMFNLTLEGSKLTKIEK
jgi:lipid-binding SYLF domain-containing protein